MSSGWTLVGKFSYVVIFSLNCSPTSHSLLIRLQTQYEHPANDSPTPQKRRRTPTRSQEAPPRPKVPPLVSSEGRGQNITNRPVADVTVHMDIFLLPHTPEQAAEPIKSTMRQNTFNEECGETLAISLAHMISRRIICPVVSSLVQALRVRRCRCLDSPQLGSTQ